ncbi:hypothetical protein BMS3Abin16_01570 [archaeon BMS3Abin16]|nr:hypothetical protein BMS3Abin16_01570 [archaeon BMS3Abin16]GBE56700.1 hypothetical protein BMS3Bbin16_00910 [archaeon BMS3Bbin16]
MGAGKRRLALEKKDLGELCDRLRVELECDRIAFKEISKEFAELKEPFE